MQAMRSAQDCSWALGISDRSSSPYARRLVADARVNDSILDLPRRTERAWTAGVMALAEGRAQEAEAALRDAADAHVCTICPLTDLARAYEARGNTAAAIGA